MSNDGPICERTDLPQAWCAHCRGSEDIAIEDAYEVTGRPFEARFPGRCTLDDEHTIRRGDLVAYVRHADNPMLPVPGVACASCVKSLPRAHR